MASPQSGILASVPTHGCYLSFNRAAGVKPDVIRSLLVRLAPEVDGESLVLGLGAPLMQALDAQVPGLKTFPSLMFSGVSVPVTQCDLWLWLREGDDGELFHRAAGLIALLADGFDMMHRVDGFKHRGGRDLTGYVDGTENPTGDDALAAAVTDEAVPGLQGSSFVAVQLWQHDFDAFHRLGAAEKDNLVGRRLKDNVEFDAPPSAHVKRTAQEDFAPEAFVLRRSTSWREGTDGGLHFVAFGCSFYAFEAQMKRMMGADDGIVDGMFQISRPLTGEYYWCPPMTGQQLDLSLLGL
ncbi:Dyp-type peroxidase [Aestuariicella hydrocarbonica]|uniref:Dyp-type peroxidase n=1 Tax=Pseudomaricurvus hydrocarbonicus TaxID=1470433 RepID=A0A9E5T260_9GAMM|nr:Dyp-type peroxidase [Aestuariicella hydrocarbonica]NHO68160.1 Dyp-type peroxidase [Aestuariicella hydrocarbonica]